MSQEDSVRVGSDDPSSADQSEASSSITANDPRIVPMLSTEHWSVLTSRSLAYNEAFTRAGMFLSSLSMSMVALGLLAQGTGFSRTFTIIAAGVLAFDVLIGLSTFLRIAGANYDDLVALHGMSRIRHAYTQIAPALQPYFTAPIHDDADSLMRSYPSAWGERPLGMLSYVISTTLGMVGLIESAIAGVLIGVIVSLLTDAAPASVLAGVAGGVLTFAGLAVSTFRVVARLQGQLPVMFPAEAQQ